MFGDRRNWKPEGTLTFKNAVFWLRSQYVPINKLNSCTEATLFPAVLQKNDRLFNLSTSYDPTSEPNSCYLVVSYSMFVIEFFNYSFLSISAEVFEYCIRS